MGVHRNCDSDEVLFITDDDTAEFLQQIASDVYGLSWGRTKDAEVLNKYSAHSIRVTAANLLHRASMSDSYIQTRLRWNSQTFLDYLRNTIYAADQHSAAMNIPATLLPDLH